MAEINFDGLVGPTHNYAGLSQGNLASEEHGGHVSTPRAAALQGLEKTALLRRLGIAQGILPPQPRPSIAALRKLGFSGSAEQVINRVAQTSPLLLRLCSSASAMWTANAATVAPASDTADGRTHLVVANLAQMFHRQIEAETTTRVLGKIFSDDRHFKVHAPLPPSPLFGDEGAANHLRLWSQETAVHLFAWGRSSEKVVPAPTQHPARQSFEASLAVARLLEIGPRQLLFPQQDPIGIDGGAFHTDVLAVGNENFLMLHEHAFRHQERLLKELKSRLGASFQSCLVNSNELSTKDAVSAYPFNSQLVSLPKTNDSEQTAMALIAPSESQENAGARGYLERVLSEDNPVRQIIYQDVRQSMANGGGPACLRLRVPLSPDLVTHLGARVVLDDALTGELVKWVNRYYPEELTPEDLADPWLARNSDEALDALTQLLELGSVYDFQR